MNRTIEEPRPSGSPAPQVITTEYGPSALLRLREVVAELKASDPMSPVTIVVPNNIAGIVAQRHLAAGVTDGSAGIAGIDATTLPRLAERIAAHNMTPRRPATRTVAAAAWRTALETEPGNFVTVADHPATARALSSAHTELRDLSDAALDSLIPTTDLTEDVVRLHRQVEEQLSADWYDEVDLLTKAAELVKATGFASPVVLYLPQSLSRAEAAFARELADEAQLIIIAALTGAERADEAVRRSLQRLGVDASKRERRIATAGTVINASDSDDEVRCVVRELLTTLKSVPAHRVAVLYAGASPYARLLHEQLSQAGITVNGRGVRPVNERALARTLLEVLALVDRDVPRADLFRAMANASTRTFERERFPMSRWERISRSAGVVRGDDWRQRLERFAADKTHQAEREEVTEQRQWLADRMRRDADDALALSEFACTLRDGLAHADTLTGWSELADWCLDLFTTLVGAEGELVRLPVDEQYAATKIRLVLAGLATLDGMGGAASLSALRDVLELEIESALPRVGKFGEGVFVGPITAAVGLDLDVVYVIGLSEDAFPGRLRDDALLPERARVVVAHELPGNRERLHAKYRALLVALESAPTVIASFPRGDLRRSSQRLPSRWLLPSLREISGKHQLPATKWQDPDYGGALLTSGSFAGELLSSTALATEQEWRTRQAAAGALVDDAVDAATGMIAARGGNAFTRFDGNLSTESGLPDYAVDEKLVSPTTLESFASCPHAFFVKRLLGVEPLEQPEDVVAISPADIGNLIHQSFEQLVEEFSGGLPTCGQPWTQAQRSRLMEIAANKGRDFEAQGLTGHPTLWEGERLRITTDLITMLDADDEWHHNTNTAVVASELAFGQKGKSPVEIVIPGGRVLMRGSADKVDIAADGTIYVTDIKTGSKTSFKGISQDDPVVGGTKLQLPVYAYAARDEFGDRATPVVTSYWFVRRTPGRIELDLTPEVEAVYAETLDVIVRSISGGMFPAKAPADPDFAWVQCPYCNPDGLGHAEPRERWERKRHDPALHDLVSLIDAKSLNQEGPS